MKHTPGYTPRCDECYYYTEKNADDEYPKDGWCSKGLYINNKKRLDGWSVWRFWNCERWEDADDRVTIYELLTGKAEPSRTGLERILVEEVLKGESND